MEVNKRVSSIRTALDIIANVNIIRRGGIARNPPNISGINLISRGRSGCYFIFVLVIEHENVTRLANINSMLIEVEETYEKLSAIVEAIKARGFSLRNLTDIAVNQLTDYTI